MIDAVLRAFRAANVDLDDHEMADALWLALCTPQGALAPSMAAEIAVPDAATDTAEKTVQLERKNTEKEGTGAKKRVTKKIQVNRDSLRDSADLFVAPPRQESNVPGIGVSRVRVPAAPGLHNALAIARSLRPLARRFASRHAFQLDEAATAEHSAEAGMLIPVFRPERERRFEVALVVEDLPSMALWRRVVAEFHRLLNQQGAFRDVRRWTLSFADGVPHLFDPTGELRHTNELRHPEARRIVLVVSDCLSAAWYGQGIARLLADWGTSTPVAVLQLLPEHLWPQTAIGAPRARLSALVPATPNVGLGVERAWWDDDSVQGELPLPILNLDESAIGEWSRLLMGLGAHARGIIVSRHLEPASSAVDGLPQSAVPPSNAQERLDRFRSLVSARAYRLATFLAVVPLTLPVMRLVQSAMFARPDESQLAEVLLGGIIERVTPRNAQVDDNEVQYEFAADRSIANDDGRALRDLLLKSLKRSEMHQVIATVSDYVSDRAGLAVDFNAWVRSNTPTDTLPESARLFATLAASAVQRLGSGVKPHAGAAARPIPGEGAASFVDEEVFSAGLTIRRRIGLPISDVEQIAWSPDGKWIAIRKDDRGTSLITVQRADGTTFTTIRAGENFAITAMVWSQSSNEIAYAVNDPFGGQGVYIERVPQLTGAGDAGTPPIIADGIVADMDWRLANDELTVTSDSGVTQVFRRAGDRWSEAISELPMHVAGRTISALSWSPNASYLAVLFSDGGVETFQPDASGRMVTAGRAGLALGLRPDSPTHARPNASYIAWHPQAAWFAYVRPDGSVHVVGPSLNSIIELINTAQATNSPAEIQLSVSHDGAWLAMLFGQKLRVFSTTHWIELSMADADAEASATDTITRIAFAPGEPTLAVTTESPHELLLLRPDFDSLPRALPPQEAAQANAEPHAVPDAEPVDEFVPKYQEILHHPSADTPPFTARQQVSGVTWDYVIVVAGSYSDTSIVDAGSELAALRMYSWATGGATNPGIEVAFLGPSPSTDTRNTIPPNVDALNSTLKEFIRNASNTLERGERARLIFYFAGDAIRSGDSLATLVLTDATEHQQLQAIRASEYLDMMVESNAFHEIVFIADCADRSVIRGKSVESTVSAPVFRSSTARSAQVFTMMSVEAHTSSTRPFTDALISGLTAGAADALGDVYANALFSYVSREQDRIVRSNAVLRPLIGRQPVMTLSGADFSITRAGKRASQVRVTPDRMYEGRLIRIRDMQGARVSEFTYMLRGNTENFVTINPGAYVAEVVGLQNSRAFNVYGNGEPVYVSLPWMPTPHRVLVVGTGRRDLSDRETMCATQLGLALAFRGLRLVTGGWIGVDYIVGRAYSKQLERQDVSPNEYFTQVVPRDHRVELTAGRIERIESSDSIGEMQRQLDLADVVIAIGGMGGTLELMQLAEARNIPVVPWVATGGDAAAPFAVEMLTRTMPSEAEWLSAPIESDEQAGTTAERIAALTLRLINDRDERAGPSAFSQTNA